MNAITTYRPGLLGHQVINEVFDNFFNDRDLFSNVLKQSTKGYPVADIYRDDDGSTVLEFALAGFKKKELSVDIQPGKRTITITGQVDEKNPKRQRIARRNFTRTFVNYDDNLDLEEAEAQFSGVNLDSQAAALIDFQQAYQASSRILQTARELFQTLIDTV